MERDFFVKLLQVAATHKQDINAFVNRLDENDVTVGRIELTDELLCSLIEPIVREKSDGAVYDFEIVFDDGYIFVAFKVKKLMVISVSLVFEIIDFKFNAEEHSMFCSYNLLGQSFKNMAIHDLIRNFGKNDELLKKGIVIGGNSISISFDKMAGEETIPAWLTLTYEKCDEGKIVFRYEIE